MAADKYVNAVGVSAIKTWIEGKFALDSDLDSLQDQVDELITEGGEPNVIESIVVNGAEVPPVNKEVRLTVPNSLTTSSDELSIETDAMGWTIDFEGIKTVKVNGTALTPDSNNAVDVEVPQSVSELINDGDGTSPFATQEYVDDNGGKIDSISVNGTAQPIVSKNVDIAVPTNTSDLVNDGAQEGGPAFATIPQTTAAAVDVMESSGLALEIDGNPAGNANFDPYQIVTIDPTNALNAWVTAKGYQTQSDVASAISTAITSVYIYKGSVATIGDLPASGNTVGDVYDVQADGMNYAWTGTDWDSLGTFVDTSVLWTSVSGQTNSLTAMTVAEINAILEPTNG